MNDWLIPNCSEIVFRVRCLGEVEVKRKLLEMGIDPTSFGLSSREEQDLDNDEAENVEEVQFMVGDCEKHLVHDMIKIEKEFEGQWVGYDGGHLQNYLDWKKELSIEAVAKIFELTTDEVTRRIDEGLCMECGGAGDDNFQSKDGITWRICDDCAPLFC